MLGEQAQIFRQIAGREGQRDIGHRQHHVLRAAAGLGVGRGRQQEDGERRQDGSFHTRAW